MRNLRSRVVGLVTTALIVVFVVGTPILLAAVGAVPGSGAFHWSTLTSPDDGTLALAIVGVVVWLAWLVMTVSLATETVARVCGARAHRIPGLTVPQLAAGRLIATASLLFVTLPVTGQALPTPSAQAFPVALAHESPPGADHTAAPPDQGDKPPASVAAGPRTPTVRYVVRRGDSLWKIAQ